MKRLVWLIYFFLTIVSLASGQDPDASVAHTQQAIDATDKMKSGNTKEVQNNFLQASLNNIFGPNNSFSINPSFFAIDSLLSKKSRNVDAATFMKQRALRNIQLVDSISINNPDNSIKQLGFSKLSFGLSIALKNNKDIRYGTFANDPKYLALNSKVQSLFKTIKNNVAHDAYVSYLKNHTDQEARNYMNVVMQQTTANLNSYWIKYDSNLLSNEVKAEIDKLSADDGKLLKTDTVGNMVKILAARYSQKGLWTVYPAYAYNVKQKQSSYQISTEYTKGIRKNKEKAPWELDLKAAMIFGKDSTASTIGNDNKLFTFSAGVNFILHRDGEQASTMELKPYFQNNYQFAKKLGDGHQDSVTVNVVYRIKVFNSFWIPLTISYDINKKDHPLFGFISFALSLDSDSGSGKKKSKK